MRRFLLAAALVTVLAAVPSTANAAFRYGVSSAEVTSNSALLWGRAIKSGKARLVVGLDKKFKRKRITKTVFAKKANDLTVQSRVAGLAAARRYYYFFVQGKQRSVIGTFKTAPKSRTSKTIRFAVTGDADPVRVNGQNYWNKDGSNDWATYKAMTREKNDFNVNLGDTIYSDAETDLGFPRAFSLAQKRAKYRLGADVPEFRRHASVRPGLQPVGRPRVRGRLHAEERGLRRRLDLQRQLRV
jgi:phosphodiesterase/alkaline phosphatase D-like protein